MKRLVILLSAMATLAAAPAAAQPQAAPQPARPYRGLFGGGVGDTEQLLVLNVSLGGGYSDNVIESRPAAGGVDIPTVSNSSSFGSMSGQLGYSLNRTRLGINGSVATSSRYYPAAAQNFVASYSGNVGMGFQVTESTRVSASHSTTYHPFRTLNLFPELFETPGQSLPTLQELAIGRSSYFSHMSSVALSQGISRRAALMLNYDRNRSDFGAGAGRDFGSHTGGAGVTLGLARGLGVRAGYGYTEAIYSANGNQPFHGHNIDAGLNFNRALSVSRRTTLAFGTGSSVVADRDRTFYRITGHARLNHEIGRTWNASANYARTAGFLDSLSAPVFSDSVTLAFGGMLSRRLQFRSVAAASLGELVFGGSGNGFETYTGSVGVTYGLTRYLGLGANYSYLRYSFDQGGALPGGLLSRQADRQTVRAHLSVWVPLIHRARRPYAAR